MIFPLAFSISADASRSKSAPSDVRGSQPRPTMTAVRPGACLDSETLPPLLKLTLTFAPLEGGGAAISKDASCDVNRSTHLAGRGKRNALDFYPERRPKYDIYRPNSCVFMAGLIMTQETLFG